MLKNKRTLITLIACAFMVIGLAACTTSMSYTFGVNTGDMVKVKLNTTNGLQLSQEDGTFQVKDKDGNALLDGMFGSPESMTYYSDAIKDTEGVTINEQTDDYLYWDYETSDGVEHDRIVKLSSKTYAIIGSTADKSAADDAYAALELSVE